MYVCTICSMRTTYFEIHWPSEPQNFGVRWNGYVRFLNVIQRPKTSLLDRNGDFPVLCQITKRSVAGHKLWDLKSWIIHQCRVYSTVSTAPANQDVDTPPLICLISCWRGFDIGFAHFCTSFHNSVISQKGRTCFFSHPVQDTWLRMGWCMTPLRWSDSYQIGNRWSDMMDMCPNSCWAMP